MAYPAQSPRILEERERSSTAHGGYCPHLPQDTLQRYAYLIGQSGIIEELECLPHDPFGLVHVCVARLRAALRLQNRSFSPAWTLRTPCVGKGTTNAQAQASALGEAVERYSAIFRGDEVRIKASYQQLGNKAIHPNAIMQFSSRQYRERVHGNRQESEQNWVPVPFDEQREIEWTPVWSVATQQTKYVATALCYFGYLFSPEHDFCRPDSNGNAAGANLEDAFLRGFLEVVERDAVALWWYNRVPCPSVNLASFDEAYFSALLELYRILGRDMVVLDISADFQIPAFAALSRGKNAPGDLLLGFGAHLDPRLAIVHALTELNQSLAAVIGGERIRYFVGEPLETAFLEPDPSSPSKTCEDYAGSDSDDVGENGKTCIELAAKQGLEPLVVDQTRADLGMPAVKVIVPGMRSWWARYGPGRLYDVPVKMGWRTTPLSEKQLNPCHLVV